ncbi:cytochrome C assembly family protein [Lihuaxuella thermophila]|uniref:HemX protein n=1 Tax=Lihuaxuella thermophila TaxID=1173111 RepID=A0A1H8D1B2_9BACL|nr:cytochrome c biogenesis protein CcsA [Lihuaxuella thermophila]SEN01093.1 HemX protein [Lihuaxuella thermophila]
MFGERWLYDFLIYVYALSLVFAFGDLLHRSKRSERISYAFLILVWLLQTSIFVLRGLEFFPMVTRFDSIFLYSWLLVTFTLIINRIYRMAVFVFIANMIGFTVSAINLFFARDVPPVLEKLLLSELVFVHVTMAIAAYAVFSLSSIGGILYLITNYLLKRKKWNRFLKRLPSLDQLQMFSNWLVMAGILLFLIAMILGVIYAYQTIGSSFWTDPKIMASFLVLIAYGMVFYQRTARRWHGRRLAWWNALSVGSIALNYFISDLRLSFHHWV